MGKNPWADEVRGQLTEFLKPHGFRRRGSLLVRAHDDRGVESFECWSTRKAPPGCFDFRVFAQVEHVTEGSRSVGERAPVLRFDVTILKGRVAAHPFRICSDHDLFTVSAELFELVELALPILHTAHNHEGLQYIRTQHPLLRIRERDPAKVISMAEEIDAAFDPSRFNPFG